MTFCTVEELVALREKNPYADLYTYFPGHGASIYEYGPLTQAKAESILENNLAAALRNRMQKVNRPWDLVDVSEKLDPQQNWLGFEFETGFSEQSKYEAVINHVWFNYNHVSFDHEGCSNYPVEITFAPENASTYKDKQAPIQKLLDFMNESGNFMASYSGSNVGTHINISTPSIRALSGTNGMKGDPVAYAARALNRSLGYMGTAGLVEICGREPYGGFYSRYSASGSYMEGKLFYSTDAREVFNEYVNYSLKLADAAEFLTVHWQEASTYHTLSNLYEYLKGEIALSDLELVKWGDTNYSIWDYANIRDSEKASLRRAA